MFSLLKLFTHIYKYSMGLYATTFKNEGSLFFMAQVPDNNNIKYLLVYNFIDRYIYNYFFIKTTQFINILCGICSRYIAMASKKTNSATYCNLEDKIVDLQKKVPARNTQISKLIALFGQVSSIRYLYIY